MDSMKISRTVFVLKNKYQKNNKTDSKSLFNRFKIKIGNPFAWLPILFIFVGSKF